MLPANKAVNLQPRPSPCPKSGWLPALNRALRWIGYHLPTGVTLQGFLLIAALTGVGFYLVVYRTRFGFDLRCSGPTRPPPWPAA